MKTSEEAPNNGGEADEQEAIKRLYDFVIAEMEAGRDRNAVAQQLVDHGVARDDAERMTFSIFDEINAIVERERYNSSALPKGILGGLIAAVSG